MHATWIVLAVVLAVAILASAVPKLLRQQRMVDIAHHLGFSARGFQAIGALEVAAVAGLIVGAFWTPLGIAAAIGLVALLIGAVVAHLRVKDQIPHLIAPALLAVISLAAAVTGIATL